MRTVGLGAEKKSSEDAEELKKTIKSLKASNTKLKNENEELKAELAVVKAENEELKCKELDPGNKQMK